jgi:hypothetical protein
MLAFGHVREETGPSLTALLDAVGKGTDRFERDLPDFIATETLTQELFKKEGKLIERRVTISLLAGRQFRIEQKGRVEFNFRELRQVQSINGKQMKSRELKPEGTQVGGAFSSILLSHFASRDQRDYDFNLESHIDSVQNRPAFLLTFESRQDNNHQFYLFNGKSLESRQRGRAWIDTITFTPLRIEYHELNLPKKIRSMFYAVDYSPVSLDGETFMLPIAAYTEVEEEKEISRAKHEYREYRKFSTDIKVD